MKAQLVLLTALVIASAHQTLSGDEFFGDWTYTVSNNQATITGYSGAGGAVVIPTLLPFIMNEVPVVDIATEAFTEDDSITSIIIPDSVTSIQDLAFYKCTSLSSITIPDSMTEIGLGVFDSCTSLTSITIPDTITSIGENAFFGCTSLSSAILPILFMDDYSSYSLSTDQVVLYGSPTALDSAEATVRSAGQNDVISDPATYSLHTASDVTSTEAAARALGQGDVIDNPTIHGLFGENTVEDVRIGETMMRKNSEGKLLFNFQIQASDDLQNWTTLDTPEYEVIPSSDKEF